MKCILNCLFVFIRELTVCFVYHSVGSLFVFAVEYFLLFVNYGLFKSCSSLSVLFGGWFLKSFLTDFLAFCGEGAENGVLEKISLFCWFYRRNNTVFNDVFWGVNSKPF